MDRFRRVFETIGREGLDLFLPNLCISCQNHLPIGKYYLCSRCWTSIPVFPGRGGTPFRSLRGVLDCLWIGWEYEDHIRRIIHLLKYHSRSDLADIIVLEFLKVLPQPARIFNVDIIIPVPIHPARRRQRGFNQSERLTESLTAHFRIECDPSLVVRVLNTPSQTGLDRTERWNSVSNAFAITRPEVFRGKRILIVDDLATSGATLHAIAQLIRKQEPVSLEAAVLASPVTEGQAI